MGKTDLNDTAQADSARVFLSYSRKDRERAEGIATALRSRNFEVFRDTDDILPTEEWRDRLQQLIEEADTIVFLLSPQSAKSEVCAWEVELAESLNKRIAPIVIEDVEGGDIPAALARLNFIFCTQRDPFENAVDTLASALSLDIDWIREHTRLNGLAQRWERADQPNRLLLRGQDIQDAENWRDTHPKEAPQVTALQARFIGQSRHVATRTQRRWIAGSLAAAGLTGVLAIFAWMQSVEAGRQRDLAEESQAIAEDNARVAETRRQEAEEQREQAEIQRFIANRSFATQSFRSGDTANGLRLMREYDGGAQGFQTLVAGLASPEAASKRDTHGVPFELNGKLYLSQQDVPPKRLELDFSATGWVPVGDDILLLSDTSRILRVDRDGQLVAQIESQSRTPPCGVHLTDEVVTVISHSFGALSAGSQSLLLTRVPVVGNSFDRQTAYYDGVNGVGLPGLEGHPKLDNHGFYMEICGDDFIGKLEYELGRDTAALFAPIQPFEKVRFPGPLPEHRLWARQDSTDTPGIVERARAKGLLPTGLDQYLQNTPIYPVALWEGENFAVLHFLNNWGGTGGDTNVICMLRKNGDEACATLHSFGGVDFTVDPINERVALYGSRIIHDASEQSSALWLMTWQGFGSFGSDNQVLSAAYDLDGNLAVLETGALITFDAAMEVMSRRPRPGKTRAVGSTGVGFYLFDTESLYQAGTVGDVSATPLSLPAGALPRLEEFDAFWFLNAAPQDQAMALGFGPYVMLYSLAGDHPLTGVYDTGLDGGLMHGRLQSLPNGGWQISTGTTTLTRRNAGNRNLDRLLNGEAVLQE